ncbi:MAG: hypothetical protein HY562_05180 [Ignavibacteriales bacterium]|nr:hypothetical protein [Ignavibacteriales bacterium]
MNTTPSNPALIPKDETLPVHYVISGKAYSEQYDELEFEGDPFLSQDLIERSKELGTFGVVQKLQKDVENVWRCTKDIRLKK